MWPPPDPCMMSCDPHLTLTWSSPDPHTMSCDPCLRCTMMASRCTWWWNWCRGENCWTASYSRNSSQRRKQPVSSTSWWVSLGCTSRTVLFRMVQCWVLSALFSQMRQWWDIMIQLGLTHLIFPDLSLSSSPLPSFLSSPLPLLLFFFSPSLPLTPDLHRALPPPTGGGPQRPQTLQYTLLQQHRLSRLPAHCWLWICEATESRERPSDDPMLHCQLCGSWGRLPRPFSRIKNYDVIGVKGRH